ncbi:hypothetical protein GCM10011331_06330 [Flavimobilis marinus]|uniref:Uncharacterized protein n=1 Tax=Flavimobilis marinus TaxID=285351 RepID=A0A1I2D1S9_9MICO|nr:hypothetical protein [Flavimobilis marinus]GHG46354.1 hypothetical protein GCM10011331_06330 [Flavimobilis marinus]SFE74482.1 hypothetical protein SAMN04488035_0361 [Flavimobilis marinus]
MQNEYVVPRLYPFDPALDRLDRQALISLAVTTGVGYAQEELRELTRNEIIDAIIGARVTAEEEAEDDPQAYEPRLVASPTLPSGFEMAPGRSLHVVWHDDWPHAALALALDDPDDSLGAAERERDGDVVMRILASNPPVVAALEAGDERLPLVRPLSWRQLCERADVDLPDGSQRVPVRAARALLAALADEIERPGGFFLVAGDCRAAEPATAVDVAVVLQRATPEEALTCAMCDVELDSWELHYFRGELRDIQLDIQDQVDDAAALCVRCHRLSHSTSLEDFRRALLWPRCPQCGSDDVRGIQYGLLTVPPDPERWVMGGCVMGVVNPRWHCDGCETRFGIFVAGPLGPQDPRRY